MSIRSEDFGTSSATAGGLSATGDRSLEVAEPSFTPGPWHLDESKLISRVVMMPEDTVRIVGPMGGTIAFSYRENFYKCDAGNHKLLAAAPDLLAALKPLAFCDDRQPPYGVECEDWTAAVHAARAAIAKATGA